MKVFGKKEELQSVLRQYRSEKKTIGFVPTMGALHQGHLSLIARCAAENDVCVVSIFVNPTQFNNPEDLEKYPRTLKMDVQLLKIAGCKYVFAPEVDEMYEQNELDARFNFDFGGLDKVMEGKFREGHFNGVVQVVSKLFDIVAPDRAYFGEKDFQQLAIIHRMVKEMKYNIEIVDCPIIREPGGLAMSSRNKRLSGSELVSAALISRILFESRQQVGNFEPAVLKRLVMEKVNETEGLEVEYFDIVNRETLQSIEQWSDGPAIGCIAVYCGNVRLIDNIKYKF